MHIYNDVNYKHHFQLLIQVIWAPAQLLLTSKESGFITDIVGIDENYYFLKRTGGFSDKLPLNSETARYLKHYTF